jgi:acetylornithine/N-succinyldiaminopimelate aminotransferase
VAVCDAIDDDLLMSVRLTGDLLADGLRELSGVTEVRGRGLLIGADVDRPAADVVDVCRERGLLVCSAGEQVLRLTPPLTIGAADVEQALAVLGEVLA